MGLQASLHGNVWWPQIDWINDKNWIATGLEVAMTTPLLIMVVE